MYLLTPSPESGGGGGGFVWDTDVYNAWNGFNPDPYGNWNDPRLTGGGFPVIEYPEIDPNTGLPKFTVTKTETLPQDTPPPLNINLNQRPDTINLGGGGGGIGGYNTNEPPVIDPNTGMPTWQVTTYGQNPGDNPPPPPPPTDNPANMGATMIIGPSRGGNMGATWIAGNTDVDMGTTLTKKPEDKKPDAGVVTNLPIVNPPANNFGDPRGQYRDPRTLGIVTNFPVVLPPGGNTFTPNPPPGGQVNNWPVIIEPPIKPPGNPPIPPPGGGGKQPGGGGTTTVQNPLLSILPSMLSAASSAPAAAQPAPLVGEQGYQTIFGSGPQRTQPVPPLAYLMQPQYPRGLF